MVSVGQAESARAAVFAEVIIRGGSEHQRADVVDGRQDLFDQPHWLDMLAELRKALPRLPSLSLDTAVSEQALPSRERGVRGRGAPQLVKRQTVRDEFAAGKPVARVAYTLARRHGVEDRTPWPVKAVVNAKLLTVPVDSITSAMLTAESMPQVVEVITRRARNELDVLAPALLLEKQSRIYLDSDGARIGRLLSDAARSYGVVAPGPYMTLLAQNWSMLYWAQAVATAGRVLVDPDGDHDLYFADGLAGQAILSDAARCAGWDMALPSTCGVLLAVGDVETTHGVLLAWRDTGTYVDIVRIPIATLCRRLRNPNLNKSMWSMVRIDRETGVADSYGTTKGVEELGRLTRLLAAAPTGPRTRRVPSLGGARRPRPAVVVRYTAKPVGHHDSEPRAAVNLEALKWRVRGHYRRQWYPSLGKHRTIWISEHYAERGSDGELVDRPVVTKLSQPHSSQIEVPVEPAEFPTDAAK
ncbi:hypothetical protein [Nocardia sp. SC052]|uniref:hypothetical protein n=1 Tax=Nocardia sichangensis TaxID=3385975 RepID=UPI0039A1BCD1